MDTFLVGSRAWAKGYCRAACIVAQHQAALDLMILEKSGAILIADTTSEATLDPITKSPFIFDPSTRELSPPPGTTKIEVNPIRLPF